MMKSDKLSKFSDSNPIQLTLREEIECMNQDLNELNGKYKDLVEKFYSQNKDNDSKNQLDQQEKIIDLEKQISFRDIDLQEQGKKIKNFESQFVQQKTSIRQAEEKISRFENWYQPRLKETQKY